MSPSDVSHYFFKTLKKQVATLWFIAGIGFSCSHDSRSGPCFQIRNTRQVHATVYFSVVDRIWLTNKEPMFENFAGVLFCGLAIFCGLREQMFAVRDD